MFQLLFLDLFELFRVPSPKVELRDYRIETEVAVKFDGQELPPYAEPISSTELEEGAVYFAVNYADDEMLVPTIETLVFVGKNLEPDDTGEAYFQDVSSYREGVPYGWDADDGNATFYSGPENELNHIFNYEHALEELMRCSLRRKQQSAQIDRKE